MACVPNAFENTFQKSPGRANGSFNRRGTIGYRRTAHPLLKKIHPTSRKTREGWDDLHRSG